GPYSQHFTCFSANVPPPLSTLFPYTTLFRSRLRALLGPDGAAANASPSPGVSADAQAGARHRTLRPHCPHAAGSFVSRADCRQRSEEHTSELQSRENLVCRLLLEKKKNDYIH